MLFPDMSNWRVRIDGRFVQLLHPADDEGELWSGAVEIVRGAPAADSHPELEHAFLAMDLPAPHQAFIRHAWTYEIPETYRDLSNLGEQRRYLILRASGREVNWTLDLQLPHATPRFVYKAICRAFNATLKSKPARSTAKEVANGAMG